jgi:hypothetical protein
MRTTIQLLPRTALAAAAAMALLLTLAPAAFADATFPTMNNGGGIYWRAAPDWNTPVAQVGNGHYPGTVISISCSQAGTSVPGSTNTMWVKAAWAGGPGRGSGWINEHYVNDNAPINQAAPSVRSCSSTPAAAPAPAPQGSSVGCYGDYCSGRDPVQTGCDRDARTVAWKDAVAVRLEVRWSPRCKTNWARLQQFPRGNWYLGSVPLELRAVQDTGYTQTKSYGLNGAPNGATWSPMIYSPVHGVKAQLLVTCGDGSPIRAAFDCATNGRIETAWG